LVREKPGSHPPKLPGLLPVLHEQRADQVHPLHVDPRLNRLGACVTTHLPLRDHAVVGERLFRLMHELAEDAVLAAPAHPLQRLAGLVHRLATLCRLDLIQGQCLPPVLPILQLAGDTDESGEQRTTERLHVTPHVRIGYRLSEGIEQSDHRAADTFCLPLRAINTTPIMVLFL